MKISNWGNYPKINATVESFRYISELRRSIGESRNCIVRGLGRSYGDSSLSESIKTSTSFNKFLTFDEDVGILTCESGLSLHEILEIIVPKGWFLPITPGTRYVTVGGAIASDVHGKNHHKSGSFSDAILSLDLMLSSGDIVTCSRADRSDLFHSVCGGMGLIGVIVHATFKLQKIETAFIKQTTYAARSLDEIMDLFEEHGHFSYSVAWIDSLSRGNALGRSILILGEHAQKEDIKDADFLNNPLMTNTRKKINIPFYFPNFVLNTGTAKAFNCLYYHMHATTACNSLVDFDSFFYPLDAISHWNRIYGTRGFLQYQFVLPKEASRRGITKILKKINQNRGGSFLGVLKLFGKGNNNLLSFPMAGYSMALDFPFTPDLLKFLTELDKEVLEGGGRLYLAKDARMSKEMFMKSYGNAEIFLQNKYKFDRGNKFQSLQSKRLGI